MKNLLCISLVVLCLESHLVAQSCTAEMPKLLVETKFDLPTGRLIQVKQGDNLQQVIDNAQLNDVIEIQAGASFTGNYTLRKKTGAGWIYIISSALSQLSQVGERIRLQHASYMPKILAKGMVPAFNTENGASHYRLVGLEIGMPDQSTDQFNLITLGSGTEKAIADFPHHIIIDRCYIHGNDRGNLKIGVALNCMYGAVIDSHIDNIHAESGKSTFESKAIAIFNSPGPFKIENNYLEASHINILFGGAVTSIKDIVPTDAVIQCNTMTKRKSWNPADATFGGIVWGVKNLFEIKSGKRIFLDGNILEHCWPSDPNVAGGPQHGWAILLTTRDENKQMPWAVIDDIIFKNNIVRHANAGVSIYGSEGLGQHRIEFENNLFYGIGGSWGNNDKSGRLYQITEVDALCLNHNTMMHASNNILFAYGRIGPVSLTNNILQWRDGFQGLSFTNWEKNVFIGGKSTGFSGTNYFPAKDSDVGFVNYSGDDFKLASTSPYKSAATDGQDIGCNIMLLNSCTQTNTTIYNFSSQLEYKVMPNPNDGECIVEHEYADIQSIMMYDLIGNSLSFTYELGIRQIKITFAQHNPGLYHLVVWDKEGRRVRIPVVKI